MDTQRFDVTGIASSSKKELIEHIIVVYVTQTFPPWTDTCAVSTKYGMPHFLIGHSLGLYSPETETTLKTRPRLWVPEENTV